MGAVGTAGKGMEGIVAMQPLQHGEGVNPNPMTNEDSEEPTLGWTGGLPLVSSNMDKVCPGTRRGTSVE